MRLATYTRQESYFFLALLISLLFVFIDNKNFVLLNDFSNYKKLLWIIATELHVKYFSSLKIAINKPLNVTSY